MSWELPAEQVASIQAWRDFFYANAPQTLSLIDAFTSTEGSVQVVQADDDGEEPPVCPGPEIPHTTCVVTFEDPAKTSGTMVITIERGYSVNLTEVATILANSSAPQEEKRWQIQNYAKQLGKFRFSTHYCKEGESGDKADICTDPTKESTIEVHFENGIVTLPTAGTAYTAKVDIVTLRFLINNAIIPDVEVLQAVAVEQAKQAEKEKARQNSKGDSTIIIYIGGMAFLVSLGGFVLLRRRPTEDVPDPVGLDGLVCDQAGSGISVNPMTEAARKRVEDFHKPENGAARLAAIDEFRKNHKEPY